VVQVVRRSFGPEKAVAGRYASEKFGPFALSDCKSNPELLGPSIELEDEAWDQVGYLDHTASHHTFYHRMETEFPEFRLSMFDINSGEVVATGVCLPVTLPPLECLPDEGWDWAVKTAFEQRGSTTTSMVALSVSVSRKHRELGLARDVINAIRQLAHIRDCAELVVPVRPSLKSRHQRIRMSDYVMWRDESGRIFDPWLRSHLAVGGQVVSVCERSMLVIQPLEFWREWVEQEFDYSGYYELNGGLSPLEVDLTTGFGRYCEPNVWVRHQI
jgi:hypothetical protein